MYVFFKIHIVVVMFFCAVHSGAMYEQTGVASPVKGFVEPLTPYHSENSVSDDLDDCYDERHIYHPFLLDDKPHMVRLCASGRPECSLRSAVSSTTVLDLVPQCLYALVSAKANNRSIGFLIRSMRGKNRFICIDYAWELHNKFKNYKKNTVVKNIDALSQMCSVGDYCSYIDGEGILYVYKASSYRGMPPTYAYTHVLKNVAKKMLCASNKTGTKMIYATTHDHCLAGFNIFDFVMQKNEKFCSVQQRAILVTSCSHIHWLDSYNIIALTQNNNQNLSTLFFRPPSSAVYAHVAGSCLVLLNGTYSLQRDGTVHDVHRPIDIVDIKHAQKLMRLFPANTIFTVAHNEEDKTVLGVVRGQKNIEVVRWYVPYEKVEFYAKLYAAVRHKQYTNVLIQTQHERRSGCDRQKLCAVREYIGQQEILVKHSDNNNPFGCLVQ